MIEREGTVIFDIVEHILMEWTMPKEAEYAGYAGGVLILKKRRRVMLASLPQSSIGQSETYCWTQKLNREDYGVDKFWGTSCCCKRVNTVEKQ